MRKKWWTVGIGFGVGAVLLFVSGFSAMANTSGYDAYKEALKNTKALTSMTANVDLTVTDNGKQVLAGTASIKLNKESDSGSVAAAFDDGTRTQSLNVFRQDGKVIFKSGDEDVYRVMEHDDTKWRHEGEPTHPPKAAEQVFDALMGNMRELATVEAESDGGKQAALHLSGSGIPAVVNALGTLAVSKLADCDRWDEGTHADMKVNVPKLTDNVKIQTINLDANINPDNVLERQKAEIRIAGSDDSGEYHDLVFKLQVDFSGLNETVPERVDLTGKQTVEVEHDRMNRGWHH
ncbi:hypothetical protein [Paenibacillus alkalitolerans]|uniref:hypothetical protein n=1 Tax=Paenibacillus alkalitolerans TaxID=2799335 RepID=UPI0018F4DAEB|nr:hypothetical protein [Paenibacillus alkalitolerans]